MQNLVQTGQSALEKVLAESGFDLEKPELTEFRKWLEGQLVNWQRDPTFQLRVQIRDIRHSSCPLRRLEKEVREVHEAYQKSPLFAPITHTEKELDNSEKAIQGLKKACAAATDDKRKQALENKLAAFRIKQQELTQRLQELTRSNPLLQRLRSLEEELDHLRSSLNLDVLEQQLANLLRRRGQRSGHAGNHFEQLALAAVQKVIAPELAHGVAPEQIRILTGVTLGASRVELDQVVLVQPEQQNEPVTVLAIIETKRNINDLAHGFQMRQENLAWLTGLSTGYDPQLYRNRLFPTGHFDRDSVWQQEQEQFVFNRNSFRLFRPDPTSGFFLDRLCFVTRPGTVWGVSSSVLSRLQYRVATDDRFQIDSDAYIKKLQNWLMEARSPLETPDVLRLYAQDETRARQILLLEPR